jgi:hypothetical protein
MLIANPIYDVVFKYLMEDSKVAKLLLSAIIGTEIVSLEFRPQEYAINVETNRVKAPQKYVPRSANAPKISDLMLTVYRLDFSAKIKSEEGENLVIIEVQKAKLANDIVRFRRYLAKQYEREDNILSKKARKGKTIKVGIPIISIYFLGEELDSIHNIPVLKVNNEVTDLYSGVAVLQKDDFIESLTHKSYIISIPDLGKKRRNELEMLLSVFDQANRQDSNHILNVQEDSFPEKYRPIIRRLQKAGTESKLRERMQDEDDILSDFIEYEHQLAEAEKKLAAKDKALEELNQELQTAQIKLETSVQKLWAKGMKIAEIADLLGVAESEVKEIVEKL